MKVGPGSLGTSYKVLGTSLGGAVVHLARERIIQRDLAQQGLHARLLQQRKWWLE
ncbi:hypothetical protein [uncultured Nocardioides sp.]|uniref:hypothetical protein n=1 Tax=uncultured Nocardioides sp. TaxID=198441 RepID=UPI00260F4135|nr:hypothetical protein [uncultured Nocardioides sp.]